MQNGAKVYIASRKESQLQEACKELNSMAKSGGSAHYIVSSLSGKDDCDTLIANLASKESKLHILVNKYVPPSYQLNPEVQECRGVHHCWIFQKRKDGTA